MSLEDYRSRIDAIDEEIVKKLEERMRIAENIAKYKQENGLQVMDVYREREKIDKITEIAADDMASYTRVLYNTIMELSKDHQRKITRRNHQWYNPSKKHWKKPQRYSLRKLPSRVRA